MSDEVTRVRACSVADVGPGEAVQVDVDPPVAVFNVDGEFFATDDTCTHDSSSLADGYVDDDVVECAFHFAKFCIRTGEVMSLPATVSLRTYRVVVEDDTVYVEVSPAMAEGG